jgi:hypothetical protein
MKRFAYLAIVLIAALPLLLTSGSASAAPSTAKASAVAPRASAVHITAVGLLSDGRLQAFRSEGGAKWIQSSWQVGSSTGPWTIWVSFPYPPTNAGVSSLKAGIQNNITYLYVYTNGGGTWETHKLSTNPNDAGRHIKARSRSQGSYSRLTYHLEHRSRGLSRRPQD